MWLFSWCPSYARYGSPDVIWLDAGFLRRSLLASHRIAPDRFGRYQWRRWFKINSSSRSRIAQKEVKQHRLMMNWGPLGGLFVQSAGRFLWFLFWWFGGFAFALQCCGDEHLSELKQLRREQSKEPNCLIGKEQAGAWCGYVGIWLPNFVSAPSSKSVD